MLLIFKLTATKQGKKRKKNTIFSSQMSKHLMNVLLYTISSWDKCQQKRYRKKKMKRLILFLVLVLHSIRFYNDYRSASALTHVSAENTYFASNRYFQFEKGTFIFICIVIFLMNLLWENSKFLFLVSGKWNLHRWRMVTVASQQRW